MKAQRPEANGKTPPACSSSYRPFPLTGPWGQMLRQGQARGPCLHPRVKPAAPINKSWDLRTMEHRSALRRGGALVGITAW